MQEKIIDEMKYWGEEDFTKEDILEMLNEELKSLEEELR